MESDDVTTRTATAGARRRRHGPAVPTNARRRGAACAPVSRRAARAATGAALCAWRPHSLLGDPVADRFRAAGEAPLTARRCLGRAFRPSFTSRVHRSLEVLAFCDVTVTLLGDALGHDVHGSLLGARQHRAVDGVNCNTPKSVAQGLLCNTQNAPNVGAKRAAEGGPLERPVVRPGG